jgi:hypothetical protein
MSDYDGHRRRSNRTLEPEYIETQETYIQRGTGNRDLVLRPRDDDYDDRDYRRSSYRDDYYDAPRRSKSSHYHGRDSRDYGDSYDDGRGRRSSRYYDDDSYYSDDNDRPPRRERRKSTAGKIIEDLGLGGVAAAVVGKVRSRSQSRRRRSDDGYGSRDGDRHRSDSRETRRKWQQAAKAAVITGVIEAVRSRKEPGGWAGEKGQRVATAALGAAGIDGFLDRDSDGKSKRHIVESVIGGLAANRLANGPRDGRSSSRGRSRSRSRSVVDRLRSRSRSIFRGRSASRSGSVDGGGRGRSKSRGLAELAAAGGVVAAGKAIYDRVRSKSRGRLRRDASADSDDSYVPSRQQRYQQRGSSPQDSRRGGAPDEYDDRGRSAENEADGGDANRSRDGSSSSVDTDELKDKIKSTRSKQFLTAALASVATIHAAHGVYSSMVASETRHKKVEEGKISPEQARKLKSKNMLQDAAAVGIAALGIKSAFSEWKEMTEIRRERHEIDARRRRHLKQKQKRDRDMRMQPYGYPPQIQQGAAADYYRGSPQYGDANPYQSYGGNIPPPPVGGAPGNRYD